MKIARTTDVLKFLLTLKLRTAVAMTFLALFILGVLPNYRTTVTPETRISWDGYFEIAYNLAHGNGYVFDPGGHKVLHRPPLYVAVLAPGALLPMSLWRIYVGAFNCACVAAVAAMVLHYGRPRFGAGAAAIAWLLLTFHPNFINNVQWAHSAFLQMLIYSAILVASWRLWIRWKNDQPLTLSDTLGYGILLGCGALVHGTMLMHAALPLTFFALCAIRARDFRFLRFAIASGLTLLLLVAPWTYRNYKITGAFIPVVANSGMAYFAGNALWGITKPPRQADETLQQSDMRHIGFPREPEDTRVRFYGFRNFADEQFANAQAKRHMREHPGDFCKKVFWNALDYYFPIVEFATPPPGSFLYQYPFLRRVTMHDGRRMLFLSCFNALEVGLAIFGLWQLFKQPQTRVTGILALLAWAAFAVPYLPFLTAGSHQLYTFATIPIMAMLVGIGIASAPAQNFLRTRCPALFRSFQSK